MKYIQERIDPGLLKKSKCIGTGAGCLPAATIRFGIDADRVIEELIIPTVTAGNGLWGPLTRISGLIKPVLEKLLPTDKQRLSQDNLQVSLTRMSDLSHVLKSGFESKEELIATVSASLANPFTSSLVNDTRYFSGAYTNSNVVFDKHTFTISGKAQSANISPDTAFTPKEELEPCIDNQIYRKMVSKGYQDASAWFEKRWNAYVLSINIKRAYSSPKKYNYSSELTEVEEMMPKMINRAIPLFTFTGDPLFGAFFY